MVVILNISTAVHDLITFLIVTFSADQQPTILKSLDYSKILISVKLFQILEVRFIEGKSKRKYNSLYMNVRAAIPLHCHDLARRL